MVGASLFGLIGKDISHSFSACYFNRKFLREGIDASYQLFDLPEISEFKNIIASCPALRGINVTSPYKREIIPYLDSLSPEASQLNAVNVVEFIRANGAVKLKGHNTDSEGFRKTLPRLIEKDTKALILGTGGASSAVAMALSKEGVPYKIVSRSPSVGEIDYYQASGLLGDYCLVINATPVGMGNLTGSAPDLDYSRITPSHICYDLIYNPAKTLFLNKAEERGAVTVNGLEMLYNQAELSWNIWNDNLTE